MKEKIDKAIAIVLSEIRTNLDPDEALKQTQAVLNLMHARVQWAAVEQAENESRTKTTTDSEVEPDGKMRSALLEVAEAAAVLFRPPYRRGAGIQNADERRDFDRLFKALTDENCPVDIGEMLT